ncbi:MAG: porin family protein [Luteibaculum sp.]
MIHSSLKAAKVLKIGTLALLLGIGFKVSAQNNFRLGLHFSPNFGWFKSDENNLENDGSVLNYSYGLITEFNLGESQNYAVATGLSVFNQSGALKVEDENGDIEVKQRLQYLEIPAVLKLKSNEIGYLTYFGKFGLSNKFNIAAETETKFGGQENTETNKSDVQFYSASLLVGVGAEYNLSGNTSFLFGLDFHNGFTNLYTKDSDIGKVRPYNITISAGVMF